MKKFVILGLALFAGLFFAFACGGGSSSKTGTAQLRILNAVAGSNFNVLLGGASFASNVAYNDATAYTSVPAGTGEAIEWRGTTGSTSDVIDQTLTFTGANNYTYIAMGSNSVSGELFTDQNTSATSGVFVIRVINASFFFGAADIYVVPTTGNCYSNSNPPYLYTVSANIAGLSFAAASTYKQFNAGSYQLCITPHNSKTVAYAGGFSSYTAGQVETVVIEDYGSPSPLQLKAFTDVAGTTG